MLEARNVPKKPVIAVRAGSSLRHAEMALNKPFKVPLHGLEDHRIKVSLYAQLGTQTISDADEAESVCNVPVRTPDGKCSQVKLRVRRGQQRWGVNSKSAAGVEEYLSTHQLEARIQGLFESVLKKQPDNPYRFMIEELQKVKRAGQEAADAISSTGPKAPVAPSEPRPENSRPSPLQGRNYKQQDSQEEDMCTKAALAQLMKRSEGTAESSSLSHVRQASRANQAKALSNLELAHEVLRLCIRQIVAKMCQQSASLGTSRQDARNFAIEHSKNRRIWNCINKEVYRAVCVRGEARTIGVMGGGHLRNSDVIPTRNKEVSAEHKALTEQVVKSLYKKAYWIL